MKTSTEISSATKILGEERAVEYCAKAGFDAWDFSMTEMFQYDWAKKVAIKMEHPLFGNDYLKFARRFKQIGLDNGIICNQSHAPFPACSTEIRSYFKRAIECTAEAGGNICVIHPEAFSTPEENAEMYLELLPFAKEHGVKIATENMWAWNTEKGHAEPCACSTPKNFLAHIEAVNDDDFVACLDIGHAEMKGLHTSAVDMILKLGKHVQALHIHDNDKWHDTHQIPFSMNIPFEEIVVALKQIEYKGYFTLEANAYLNGYEESNVLGGLKELQQSVRRLADMYEMKD